MLKCTFKIIKTCTLTGNLVKVWNQNAVKERSNKVKLQDGWGRNANNTIILGFGYFNGEHIDHEPKGRYEIWKSRQHGKHRVTM